MILILQYSVIVVRKYNYKTIKNWIKLLQLFYINLYLYIYHMYIYLIHLYIYWNGCIVAIRSRTECLLDSCSLECLLELSSVPNSYEYKQMIRRFHWFSFAFLHVFSHSVFEFTIICHIFGKIRVCIRHMRLQIEIQVNYTAVSDHKNHN